MVKLSNNVVGIINFITFILSIPIIWAGIWLTKQGTSECENFLQKPVIAIGIFFMIVSFFGLIGACCRNSLLLWIYLCVMFLLIVLLFCFTIFTFVVTNKGAGEVLSNRGYKEYKISDYSNWLQERVSDTKNWNKIKSCLIDGRVCDGMVKSGVLNGTVDEFYKEHLSAIQSGCCKPADSCGFTYVTPIQWTKQADTVVYNDPDCNAWDNDVKTLCFNCQSCKAGVLDNLKSDWKKVATVNVIALIFLIVVYSIGCCAFRNN